MKAAGKRYIIHGSRTDEFTLWFFSDIHWMAKACSEKRVLADRDAMRDDPHAIVIGGGDYAEFIGIDDLRRFDPDAVADRVQVSDLARLGRVSYEAVRELFAPLKDKLVGMMLGNHEKEYLRRLHQEDLHGWLCTELGVDNLMYGCFFDLVFCRTAGIRTPHMTLKPPSGKSAGRQSFRVFCHHGAGFAQTKGGKMNRLVRFMKNFDADIYMMGHVHDQTGTRIPYMTADAPCRKLCEATKVGVISGSYLKTYAEDVTTYGEQRGYDPTTLGAAWVKIHPETRRLRAEI